MTEVPKSLAEVLAATAQDYRDRYATKAEPWWLQLPLRYLEQVEKLKADYLRFGMHGADGLVGFQCIGPEFGQTHMNVETARTLRDMLTDCIDHQDAGGHGPVVRLEMEPLCETGDGFRAKWRLRHPDTGNVLLCCGKCLGGYLKVLVVRDARVVVSGV